MVKERALSWFSVCLYRLHVCWSCFSCVPNIIIKDQNPFSLSKRLPPAMLISTNPQNVFFFPFFPPPPPEIFSFHVWWPATAKLHISLETGHCYHGRRTILAAIVPPMYTCHSRMERPLWANIHTPLGWMWVHGCAECWGSPCVYIEWIEFARLCVPGWVCVCVRTHVCVCPHSVSQLSLQSVYVWLQGKSSSKKWILTRRAPHINSFSHIPTQKTTYLHCISPGTPFSFWWWFRDVEISLWTSELSQTETVRQR